MFHIWYLQVHNNLSKLWLAKDHVDDQDLRRYGYDAKIRGYVAEKHVEKAVTDFKHSPENTVFLFVYRGYYLTAKNPETTTRDEKWVISDIWKVRKSGL